MLFSVDWLLELCPVERDVERIAAALTSRGLTVDAVEPRGNDHVLDVDVPANRSDCLGHFGLARELCGAFGVEPTGPPKVPDDSGAPAAGEIEVVVDDPALCPRYTARLVRGVRVGPSPDWVVRRLEACGLRSLNNVVDASNLVLLELGHPIHFFDLAKIAPARDGGPRTIRVRSAEPGEKLATLDAIDRALDPEMLMIADGRRSVAVAGVMGGADSEIAEATRDVLVEAAVFEPRSVRATSRSLGLQTDASYRFERGVDRHGLEGAQALAVTLLAKLGDGVPAPGMIDVATTASVRSKLCLRPAQLQRLLGFLPETSETVTALESIGLCPEMAGADRIEVQVPTWRTDLDREADLVEEVARHLGYDRIPTSEGSTAVEASSAPPPRIEEQARDLMAHLGFHEALGYSMIAPGEDDRFIAGGVAAPLELGNPIAEQLANLRRSILPGLLRATDLNLRRGSLDVRLFEVGRVFNPKGPGESPDEPLRLGLAWSGSAEPPHWSRPAHDVGLYDIAGIVEHVIDTLRPDLAATRRAGAPDALHPGHSATWEATERVVAWAGALHPELQRTIDYPVFLAEIELDALVAAEAHVCQFARVPRYPAVTRDLALVVTGESPFASLLEVLQSVESPAPARFDAVDRYQGPPLAADEASLTVRVTLQPVERTLTDEESESYRANLVRALDERLGIRIR